MSGENRFISQLKLAGHKEFFDFIGGNKLINLRNILIEYQINPFGVISQYCDPNKIKLRELRKK